MRSIACTAAAAALVPFLAAAQDAGIDFFEKKIRPVLAEKCYQCHNSKLKTPMGGLRLDTAAGLRKGGDNGNGLQTLVKAVSYRDLHLRMPPTGKLSDDDIASFARWVEMGAPDPRTEQASAPKPGAIDWAEARKFWAFQPAKRPEPPKVRDAKWPKTPVDRFLLAKLEAKGLAPAAPADKRTWLRRVTFDLIGLPPTLKEIREYLNDTSSEAETKVVERLLESPHYGERWARHWLDLVRFAETNGHEFDNNKLDAWRYRDYVIRAFSRDVPYDQFVREHLAGDLLAKPRVSSDGAFLESPLGTTAFWFGEVLNSATDSVKSRADAVDNQIDVFGKAFLGLTMACARCHDHKFDPIPTLDYYAMAGIMHSTDVREAVIDSPARAMAIAARHAKIGALNGKIRTLLPPRELPPVAWQPREGDVVFEDFDKADFTGWHATGEAFAAGPSRTAAPNLPLFPYRGEAMASSFGRGSDMLVGSLTSKKFTLPKLWVHVRLAGTEVKEKGENAPLRLTVVADDHKSQHYLPSGKPGFEWKTIRMTKEIGRTCYFEIVDRSRTGHIAVDRIVFSDRPEPPSGDSAMEGPARWEDSAESTPALTALQKERAAHERHFPESSFAMIAGDDAVGDVRLHVRGNHKTLGDPVPRAFLRIIAGEGQPAVRGSGRLELAERIASESNPLTARVMVNRIWKHHFGQGLVRSTDNFGKTGEPPSHPELLDWLAAEFVSSGWSVKHMHRLMVLSSAYAMSSRSTPEATQADPRNSLLHHMAARRLEGEAIRDSILAVSGKLDETQFGPGVMPHISKYQDGRGKPVSGPLDGAGRKSIYIQVRRNFVTPMFLAFDYPLPISTIGARTVSTVPSQALLMLNNEFVAEGAQGWAKKAASEEPDPAKRLDLIFEQAFARAPEDWEKREGLAFLGTNADEKAWSALCHVLFNSAEFIYVR